MGAPVDLLEVVLMPPISAGQAIPKPRKSHATRAKVHRLNDQIMIACFNGQAIDADRLLKELRSIVSRVTR